MKYSYSPSFSFVDPILIALGAGLIYFGATSSFDIAWRRLTVLAAPYSSYVIMGLGAIFLLSGLYSLIQWISTRSGGEIALDESSISFPQYGMTGSKQKTLNYTDVKRFEVEDEDEFSVTLHTEDDEFEFESSLFSGEKEYNSFLAEIASKFGQQL